MHYNNLPNARPGNPNQFQDAHVPNLPPQPVDMPELNNLSYVVRNCWHHFLFWGIFWIISALISFWNIIFFPLVFTCAGVAYWYWSKHYQESVNLKRCLQTFSWTFWLGSLIAFITEMIVVVIGAVVILNSELMTLSKRWKDRPSQSTCEGYGSKYDCTTNSCSWTGQCDRQTPQDFFSDQESWLVGRATTWIFLMFMAFMVAAGVEETVKYQFASRSIRNYLPPAESISLPFASTILWYGLMAGMGFGTSEGIEYTIFNASPLTALASLALRVLLAIPFHSCCGFLTSIQLTRRHVMKQKIGYFGCIWVPWLCHGFYDFVQFGVVILMYGDDSGAADIVTLIAAIVLTFATFYIGYSRYKALKSELESLMVDPNHNENHHSYQQQYPASYHYPPNNNNIHNNSQQNNNNIHNNSQQNNNYAQQYHHQQQQQQPHLQQQHSQHSNAPHVEQGRSSLNYGNGNDGHLQNVVPTYQQEIQLNEAA